MAKDGTNRGGARPGAGRKKKSLDEKIMEGKTPSNAMNAPTAKSLPKSLPNGLKDVVRTGKRKNKPTVNNNKRSSTIYRIILD